VSRGALGWSVESAAVEPDPLASALSQPQAVSPALWLSVLLRMRLWVRLIFNRAGGKDASASLAPADNAAPLNRRAARGRKHVTPAAHQSYALGHILLRRYGFARFVQWLYQFGLMGRVRFCFVSKRCLLWTQRRALASFGLCSVAPQLCAAPLSPD